MDKDVKWLMVREIPHLRRYARTLTGDAAQADDLTHDALERAIRKRRQWRGKGSLRAWLFKILYREFIEGRRNKIRNAPRVPLEEAGEKLSHGAPQLHAVQVRDVMAALAQLPDDQRAAVTLIAVEGFTYDEAAQILDAPAGTLRSRLSRGRAALRGLMDDPPFEADADDTQEAERAPRLRQVK